MDLGALIDGTLDDEFHVEARHDAARQGVPDMRVGLSLATIIAFAGLAAGEPPPIANRIVRNARIVALAAWLAQSLILIASRLRRSRYPRRLIFWSMAARR